MIFVGDIHGEIELLQRIVQIPNNGKFIFVGDYLDSFSRSAEDQIASLLFVLDRVENHGDIALLGNHELSYLIPGAPTATGNTPAVAAQLIDLREQILRLMKLYWYNEEHGILVTHAGLSLTLLNGVCDTEPRNPKALCNMMEEWKRSPYSPFYQVGHARGGFYPCGGPLWCDFFAEFEPLDEVIQVFGHTPVASPQKMGNAYAIDCLNNAKRSSVLYYNETDHTFHGLDIEKSLVDLVIE